MSRRYLTPEQVRRKHLRKLGPHFGRVYNALENDCYWLQFKWHQYRELFGARQERLDILNHSTHIIFRVVHDVLRDDILLHLCRLTDSPQYRQKKETKERLTIKRLPPLVTDETLRAEIERLIRNAERATKFARDWRNRRIAHLDLSLRIKQRAKPLAPASRRKVERALRSINRVVDHLHAFYFSKSRLDFSLIQRQIPGDAVSLLYVMREGLEAEEKRQDRIRNRRYTAEDFRGPRPI